MKNELTTLAIHSELKAKVLNDLLLENGIEVYLEKVNPSGGVSDGFYIKVQITDLSRALAVVEANKLFSYTEQATHKLDDGRPRVLVAVDFSEDSIKACQVAFNIAKDINAKVKILHVYNNIYFPSHFPFADQLKDKSDESILDKTRRKMLNFCIDINNKIDQKEWPSVNYSYSLREGLVDEELEAFVSEYQPSLLVMGTKGEHRQEFGLIGSVTADVLEILNIPVLAVPRNSPINAIGDIKHMLYMISLKEWGPQSFLHLSKFLHYCKDVRITLLHVVRRESEEPKAKVELNKIEESVRLQYPNLNIDSKLLVEVKIEEAIDNLLNSGDDDISVICINTRKRNLFGRIFMPSISRKILANFNKALLVLR